MIVVSGTVRVRPGLRQEAVERAVWMQALVESEPGCLSYRFYADLEHPDLFRVFEVWESDAALKAHFQTPHMAEFNRALAGLLAEKPQITRYAVSEHTSF